MMQRVFCLYRITLMTSKVSAVEMKSAKSNVIIKAFQIYYMHCHAETSVLDLCAIYAFMVESKNYYVHPVQSWWSSRFWHWQQESVLGPWQECVISICAKMSIYGGELRGVISTFIRKDSISSLRYQNVVYLEYLGNNRANSKMQFMNELFS